MPTLTLCVLIFLVAVVYASVGHGGASGYLAIAAVLGFEPAQMASSALLLNVLVAGLAVLAFRGAGHLSWPLTWPFLVTSIPAAAVGGWLPIARHAYHGVLAVALTLAAARLWLGPARNARVTRAPSGTVALPVGAGLGLLSGIVGVGGGVFLSPLLLLCRWADAKRTAATSAVFILCNSLAGLAGRMTAGRFEVGAMLPLVVAACAGGLIGSRVGANHLPNPWLCRVLGVVLAIAALKLMVT
jgi:uncharacterized membrane protein YfcA